MKLTETREFEDFVVKMARECDGASTALGRETLGRETCAAARALLSALDRERAKTEPPKIISCRKCHTLRAFGDDYCMCGERSWYVASTDPPKRTAEDELRTVIALAGEGTIAEHLREALHLVRELRDRADGNFASYERVKGLYSAAVTMLVELRAERDKLQRRIEKALRGYRAPAGIRSILEGKP